MTAFIIQFLFLFFFIFIPIVLTRKGKKSTPIKKDSSQLPKNTTNTKTKSIVPNAVLEINSSNSFSKGEKINYKANTSPTSELQSKTIQLVSVEKTSNSKANPLDESFHQMNSTKQHHAIEYLIDHIGYQNSPLKKDYLDKTLLNITSVHERYEVYEKLKTELQLRVNAKPSLSKSPNLTVTDLSAFTFCPASYAISETFETHESETMIEGQELHNKRQFLSYIENIRKNRLRKIDESKLEEKEKEKILHQGDYGDILESKLIFIGHEDGYKKPFYSNKKTLTGIPDYIFERPDKKKFIVEEKYTWNRENISTPYPNHITQLNGYIFGIESLDISYAYIIYFHWSWHKKRHLTTTNPQIFKILKSESGKTNLVATFNKVQSLKNGNPYEFNTDQLNIEKCFSCSVRALCNHKSGNFNILKIPYDKPTGTTGFTHTSIKTKKRKQNFNQAIKKENTKPMPREYTIEALRAFAEAINRKPIK